MFELLLIEMPEHKHLTWAVFLGLVLVLIAAGTISWRSQRTPNYLTFSMILAGWILSTAFFGWHGLACSFAGSLLGLMLLIAPYAFGIVGAGDAKLLAGIGAWVGVMHTLWVFAATTLVGVVIGTVIILYQRHKAGCCPTDQTGRVPAKRFMLMPYGVPIASGAIAYLFWVMLTV